LPTPDVLKKLIDPRTFAAAADESLTPLAHRLRLPVAFHPASIWP
jgi:hypothetical protein